VVTWAEIILAALKLINVIMGAVNQDTWMQAGRDAEIAKVSADILAKTQAGKAIMEKVNAMPDSDVDAGLRDLEPK
jgi:hypothetical protein